MKEEHDWREEALNYFNIPGELKMTQEQTIARPDTKVVLSMAEQNIPIVKQLYKDSGYSPIISTLGEFATSKKDSVIPNAFGKSKEEYFKSLEIMLSFVPRAVERAVLGYTL